MLKCNARLVALLAYTGCGLALFNFTIDLCKLFVGGSYHFSPEVYADTSAFAALGFAGLVALVIAKCMKTLEERVSRIEGLQGSLSEE